MTQDWLISAESDLLLIRGIMGQQDLTHLLAFHSQQVIEKSFKAIIEEFELGFYKIHSLETLYNKVKDRFKPGINIDLLASLDQLYIDSRYPGELGLLPDGKPSIDESEEFFNLSIKVFERAKLICK
jgi:HEPN domain-containing protein